MRIGLLSAFYSPELTGIGPYSAELAQALIKRGHEVRVISSFPFYPEWIARVPRGTFLYRTEHVDGVRVARCRTYVPSTPGPVRRLLHELSWAAIAFPKAVQSSSWADVWVVVTPNFGSALIGAWLSRFRGARVHIHVQDLLPDVASESGHLRPGLFLYVANAVARWTYRSFRSASVLSDSMATELQRYTGANQLQVVVAPNWIRQPRASNGRLPETLQRRSYAVYAGSSGRKQDLALLAQVADLLVRRQGPTIVILGGGPGHEATRAGGSNLVWLGLVDDATYAAVIANALAGIVALVPGIGNSVVPSKLASYLAAARPVIVSADPRSEAVRVVEQARCGFVVPVGRPEMLADALCRVAANPGEREALGARGKAYAAAHWDRERTVDLLNSTLQTLITGRPASERSDNR